MSITREDFERIHRKIVATVRGLGASEDEAEDISQEAFLRAGRGLGGFREASQLDTWIVGIAKNVWLQTYRDRRRLKRAVREAPLDVETVEGRPQTWPGSSLSASPEAVATVRQELARAKREIDLLPAEMQHALKLCAQGHAYAEIGQLLQVSVGRVSSLVYQARQKLRRRLTNHSTDAAP